MSAHRFAFPLYIGTVNKVKRFSASGLIMEIGHEGVFPAVLLHYHPLVAQRDDERYRLVVVQSHADGGIGIYQRVLQFLVAVFAFQCECRLQRDAVLLLRDVPVRVERLLLRSSGFPPLRGIVLHQFGKCPVIDAEGERLEVHRPDVHGRYPTDVGVALVLLHQQHRLGLVVQFRADVPARVLVTLVLVQYCVDMYLAVVRPLHQLGDDACGFAGAVDVVHHVADAVYHDKSQFRGIVDGLLHSRDAFFRGVLAQGEKFEVLAVPVGRRPAMRRMRSITLRQWYGLCSVST